MSGSAFSVIHVPWKTQIADVVSRDVQSYSSDSKAQEILSSLDENLITLGSTRQLFLQEDLTLSKSQLNTKL